MIGHWMEDAGTARRAARKLLGHKDTETMTVLSGSDLAHDEPARARKREGSCSSLSMNNLDGEEGERISTHAIMAQTMGVIGDQ